jgi:hypothetical protein
MVGFVLFAVVGLPSTSSRGERPRSSSPTRKEEPSREFYWFSALGPSIFLGVGGGTVLGAIFYPFGLPFMSEDKSWNEEKAPSDDEPLPPPPGGKEPPRDPHAHSEPAGERGGSEGK